MLHFSEDKHDICTTTRCATMSVYRSPFCLASLISDNQQRVRQDDRSCAGQSASIPSRLKFTSIERFFLISSPPVTTTDYFVKNFLTAIGSLSRSENYAAIFRRCNYIKLNSAVPFHSIEHDFIPAERAGWASVGRTDETISFPPRDDDSPIGLNLRRIAASFIHLARSLRGAAGSQAARKTQRALSATVSYGHNIKFGQSAITRYAPHYINVSFRSTSVISSE